MNNAKHACWGTHPVWSTGFRCIAEHHDARWCLPRAQNLHADMVFAGLLRTTWQKRPTSSSATQMRINHPECAAHPPGLSAQAMKHVEFYPSLCSMFNNFQGTICRLRGLAFSLQSPPVRKGFSEGQRSRSFSRPASATSLSSTAAWLPTTMVGSKHN
jgi:hypothetical protein